MKSFLSFYFYRYIFKVKSTLSIIPFLIKTFKNIGHAQPYQSSTRYYVLGYKKEYHTYNKPINRVMTASEGIEIIYHF